MGLAYLDLPASERDWWIARHEKKAALHSCGHSRDVCGDPSKPWYPQRTVCYPTMEREAAAARYARLHSADSGQVWHDGTFSHWTKEPTEATPYKYDMGVTVWVAQKDYSPDDDFLSVGSPGPDDEPEDREGERQDG